MQYFFIYFLDNLIILQNNVVIDNIGGWVVDTTINDLWWVEVVRGISAIAFGILILVWPGAAIGVTAFLFASLFAVYGITDIIRGIQEITKSFSGILHLLFGILQLWVVIYLFRNAGSGLTLALMGLLMAINLIVLAIIMVGSAFISDSSAGYRWAAGIAGFITLFVGITVARAPAISIVTLIYVLGIFGLFVGPIQIAAGLMLKKHTQPPLKAA